LPTTSNTSDAIAIRCEGLGKRYRIGEQVAYKTLRETLTTGFQAPFRRLFSKRGAAEAQDNSDLWALRDLTLEVKQGEVLGVIGRNGSGKSTLLKMLSRITKPTEGQAEIRGRVGTLLEVGAGFHPELTGRENIFLNGAVLGMKRREIQRKFDEIVDFSGCSRMLDTAVKHYSSGMYVRLAFAVAAHLETEILFVDEVLAVGDATFQKKCLGKIDDVAHQGRTILFVSHNMLAVDSLCTRAICLHNGRVTLEGDPKTVTSRYLQDGLPVLSQVVYDDISTAPGNDSIRLHRARVRPADGSSDTQITVRTPIVAEFDYWKFSAQTRLCLSAEVMNEHGVNLFTTFKMGQPAAPQGLVRSSVLVPADFLNDGSYRINLVAYLDDDLEIARWDDVIGFDVHDAASELRGLYHDEWPGVVRPNLEWKTELIDPDSALPG
jgi:lipopolysaccharide transport system ATP-binding protein